jgi:Fe2+ or Zn2+ uptake regulation protein
MSHVGDQCRKCNLGQFDVLSFVPDVKYASRSVCAECPPEEHLHLACTKCGYMVWDKTAEQRQVEADRAKLS